MSQIPVTPEVGLSGQSLVQIDSKDQHLNRMLVDDEPDMPFLASGDAEKIRRDDEFMFGQTRPPAITFGMKQGSNARASFEVHGGGDLSPYDEPKNDFDSNGTLQQWQKKGLF